RPNARLFEAARAHAANMAKQDKLEHDLDGITASERVTTAGYRWSRTGENIAWSAPTPKEVVAGWMDSPPHKANILSEEFTEIGVGVASNAKGERYWVQVFGTPWE
ncbi:MAG TPA: CAP domain-containing protein, partial [Gemmataceae bacterium]|nr:CAP domain-containing protein [Gemmataceae bacterium]